jgi:prepilin-type N-terminal cleavage/methylation domain-containing protein
MLAPRRLEPNRTAFTLMEILVVIAIIAIIASLLAAGIFAVIGTQRQSNTQNTMRAVYKVLSRQMKFVLDKADKETPPANVLKLANGDPKLAKLMWKKLRLKQEFPMTFAEALAPYNPSSYSFSNTATNPAAYPPTATSVLSSTDLPGLKVYDAAFKNLVRSNNTVISANWYIPAKAPQPALGQPFLESSICLLLALQQNRGGVSLSPSDLGSAAAALQIKNPSGATIPNLNADDIKALNASGLKMLVDGWGNEIAFFRFPTSNDDNSISLNNDLDSKNPAGDSTAATAGTASKFRDPYDPEGLLVNPSWNNFGNGSVGQFEQYCHLVHFPNASNNFAALTASTYNVPPGAGQPRAGAWSTYMLPTLVSAGPDGRWGLNNSFSTSYGGYYGTGANPDMSIDPNTSGDNSDNIYSYRLGLDSRGD